VPLRQGDIVWASVTPDAGEIKPRPSVVLTPTAIIESTGRAFVIGVTGSFVEGDARRYFPMPWRADGNIATGFNKPCAAARSMVEEFAVVVVRQTKPPRYLPKLQLIRLVRWLQS
jgi:hypothetical protein